VHGRYETPGATTEVRFFGPATGIWHNQENCVTTAPLDGALQALSHPARTRPSITRLTASQTRGRHAGLVPPAAVGLSYDREHRKLVWFNV
jgi:hypothetical protein